MAPLLIFSMAETILPYTPGSTFTVENAYELNGMALSFVKGYSQNQAANQMVVPQSSDSITDIWDRAQVLCIDEAESFFQSQKN